MPTKKDSEPLPARVHSSFQKLTDATGALNSASDRFSKLVGEVDVILKSQNIGTVCWVTMGSSWNSDYFSGYDQIGYAKINGKWMLVHANFAPDPLPK